MLVLTPHRWIDSFEQTILIDKLKSTNNDNNRLSINVVKADDSSFNFNLTKSIDALSQFELVKLKVIC